MVINKQGRILNNEARERWVSDLKEGRRSLTEEFLRKDRSIGHRNYGSKFKVKGRKKRKAKHPADSFSATFGFMAGTCRFVRHHVIGSTLVELSSSRPDRTGAPLSVRVSTKSTGVLPQLLMKLFQTNGTTDNG
ncbi:hypothetical protein SLE2022_146690 [Rubroshorea leprosula]